MEQPNVQVIETLRNGKWYTIGDGFFFRKKDKRSQKLKLECIEKKNGNNCNARASVRINDMEEVIGPLILGQNQLHTHGPDHTRAEEEKMRIDLFTKSENSNSKLKQIYDVETKNYHSLIVKKRSYTKVNSGMRKRRRKNTPAIPANLPNLYFSLLGVMPDSLKTCDGDEFIVHYDEENLMLISPGTAPLLTHHNHVVFCMDGTFKCTPKKPKVQQFYVLGGMIKKTFIAIAFILMEKKTQQAYEWVLKCIHDSFPAWDPAVMGRSALMSVRSRTLNGF